MFHARILGSVNQQEFYDSNGTRWIYTSWGPCPRSSNGTIHLHYSVMIHFYEVNAETTMHRWFWTIFFTSWLCQVFHLKLQNNSSSSLSTDLLNIHLSKWLKLLMQFDTKPCLNFPVDKSVPISFGELLKFWNFLNIGVLVCMHAELWTGSLKN